MPVATFLITGVSCVSLFAATQQAGWVCVFTHLRIIRIVFLPGAHLRPKGPIAVSWAPQPTKRQQQQQHARENILPKWAMRKIRAWISLVSSETVHSDRYECPSSGLGGQGSVCFLSEDLGSFMTCFLCFWWHLDICALLCRLSRSVFVNFFLKPVEH